MCIILYEAHNNPERSAREVFIAVHISYHFLIVNLTGLGIA